jgi:predicted RNA-binding protein with TRAM domain
MFKLKKLLTYYYSVNKWRECFISPRKRSPRNAKNKFGMRSCPVTLGDEYSVEIRQMSPKGEGIARVKGFLVFIANSKIGDRLKVKIINLNSISANAEIVTRF